MSFLVKREREEPAAAAVVVVEGIGIGSRQQQQHAVMMMECASVNAGASASAGAFGEGEEESRPAKAARVNDREGVSVEKSVEKSVEAGGGGAVVVDGRDGGRDVGGGAGVVEGMDGGKSRKEGEREVQQVDGQVREVVGEGKDDREKGEVRRMTDLQSGVNDAGKESCGGKEVLGKVDDVKKGDDEEQLVLQEKQGVSSCEVGQELVTSDRPIVLGLRKKIPQHKVVVKDVAMDVKKEEEPREEKEKVKKNDERKEDVVQHQHQHQHQPQLLQPHVADVDSEKANERNERVERDERDREKGEKEKERVRSHGKEKEAAVSEKREKREKERDRDPHRRERSEHEERDRSLADKVVNVEEVVVKEVKIEDVDMDTKLDERKLVEKEGRERVRDRDRNKDSDVVDGEGVEKQRKKRGREHEKGNRDSEKDAEGVGGGEKDKDAAHGNGVQQRKRMLRPRGQTNPSNRDSRSRFRPKDNEGGTQGRPESSYIKYRAGEGMPELARLWKEHETGVRNSSANGSGPSVEIRIAAEFATTANRQIRGSQLWGTDVYTDDSDIVAVLFHTGYYTPSATPPPNSISELRATVRILGSQQMYTSTLRNNLRSRAWGGGSGCSYSVERCRIVKQGGGTVELEPCLSRTPLVAPTLAPAASERTVTTRAASSSAYRQQRFMQEVTIQYNLCNEPWAKYSMSIVADRGLKKSQFTSARLKNGEVLYVETHVHRYELAYDAERTTCNGATTATSSFSQGTSAVEKVAEKSGLAERALEAGEKEAILHAHSGDKLHGNHHVNHGQVGGHHAHIVAHQSGQPHEYYRWSKCKRPLPLLSMKRKGLPLPEEFVEVLEEGLAWEEVQWSPTSVWVRGIEYILSRAQFFSLDDV